VVSLLRLPTSALERHELLGSLNENEQRVLRERVARQFLSSLSAYTSFTTA
jgi:hypothetical protein